MSAQEGAWEQNSPFKLYRLGPQQDREILRKFIAFVLEKRLFPQAPWAAVIVIPWNDGNRQLNRSDRGAGRGDRRFGGAGRIKEITGDNDELRAVNLGGLSQAVNDGDPLLLDQGTLLDVVDSRERLTPIPVIQIAPQLGMFGDAIRVPHLLIT